MEIKNAIEGIKVCDDLRSELRKLNYNPDLKKFLNNIEKMVDNISKLEVTCRRRHNDQSVLEQPLKNLNESVNYLQQLILMARIME